jgi:hypothetical protein
MIHEWCESARRCGDAAIFPVADTGVARKHESEIMDRTISSDRKRGLGLEACDCRPAVTRTYQSLRAIGFDRDDALAAAIPVYRAYHPEVAESRANEVLRDWFGETR